MNDNFSYTKIKICGLFRIQDINYVNQYQPDYVGFIVNFPKSKRNINASELNTLTKSLDKNIKAVGVFVNENINTIIELLEEDVIDIVQLHGTEDNSYIDNLKSNFPDTEIWKAFELKCTACSGEISRTLTAAYLSHADRILLDAGKGEGQQFDRAYLNEIKKEYVLAGGLSPDNVFDEVMNYHPYAVDMSSGVESNGIKDEVKIKTAINAVRCANIKYRKELNNGSK